MTFAVESARPMIFCVEGLSALQRGSNGSTITERCVGTVAVQMMVDDVRWNSIFRSLRRGGQTDDLQSHTSKTHVNGVVNYRRFVGN